MMSFDSKKKFKEMKNLDKVLNPNKNVKSKYKKYDELGLIRGD